MLLYPLWVRWRQQWAHRITCRALDRRQSEDAPSLLWTPIWSLQRRNPLLCIGSCDPEGTATAARKSTLDELLERSSPAFPSDVLGL